MSLSQEPQTDASSAVAQIGYRPRDPSILIGKKWSEEEDQKLWNLIVTKSIKSIDEEFLRELPGRSGSACRVRYYQLLRQVTLYAYDACGTWSDKDDQLLAEMHRQKEDYAQIANDHPRATTAMDCWIRLFRLLKDQIKRGSYDMAVNGIRYGKSKSLYAPYGLLGLPLSGSLSNLQASNQSLYYIDLDQRIAGQILGIGKLYIGAAYPARSIAEIIPRGEPPFEAIIKEYNKQLPTREQLTTGNKGLVKAADRLRFGETGYGFDDYFTLVYNYAHQDFLYKPNLHKDNPLDSQALEGIDFEQASDNGMIEQWLEDVQEAETSEEN